VAGDVEPHERFQNVYWVRILGSRKLATKNLCQGISVYGEDLVRVGRDEYRIWDAYRSKLAASILKGIKDITIRPWRRVLYLGAASGTTVSHVSDIVGEKGVVYGVEFSTRAARELVEKVAKYRPNVLPVVADARFPEKYPPTVSRVDTIYCDVAQPEQAKILSDNADMYLPAGKPAMIAIKARSVDVTKSPATVYEHEVSVLQQRGFEISEMRLLEPYEKDHAMVVAVYKGRSPGR